MTQTEQMNGLPERVARLIARQTGQVLSQNVQDRLLACLSDQARYFSYASAAEYVTRLEEPRTDRDREALQGLINLSTIGKTAFWRHPEKIELIVDGLVPALHQILPPNQSINIWCAACATGEEPYTIAMALFEAGWLEGARGRRVTLVATDLNSDSLASARAGRIHAMRGQEIPSRYGRFLDTTPQGLQFNQSLRQHIQFRSANLVQPDSYPITLGGWHVVICANVLFYFDDPVQDGVLRAIRASLSTPAALLLGSAENLVRANELFAIARWRETYAYLTGTWLPALRATYLANPDAPPRPPVDVVPALPPVAAIVPAVATAAAAVPREPVKKAAVVATVPTPSAPPSDTLHLATAIHRAQRGDRRGAVALLLGLPPGTLSPTGLRLVGVLLLRESRWEEACRALYDAVQQDSLCFEGHLYLGLAYARHALCTEAVETFRRALFLRPENVIARYEYGTQLAKAGDMPSAARQLQFVQTELLQGAEPALTDCEHAALLANTWPSRSALLSLVAAVIERVAAPPAG